MPAVLPADAVDLDSRLGRPLQTGDAAQQRGLAGAGGADDGGDAATGQGQVQIEGEVGQPLFQLQTNHARAPGMTLGRPRRLSSSRIRNEQIRTPPASQWALA